MDSDNNEFSRRSATLYVASYPPQTIRCSICGHPLKSVNVKDTAGGRTLQAGTPPNSPTAVRAR